MKITVNIITAKAEKAQEMGLTLTEEDTLGHRIRRAIAKPRTIQMKKFHERTIRILIFIFMFFLGVLLTYVGGSGVRDAIKKPAKTAVSIPATAEASVSTLPKGYVVEYNKVTGKFRWSNFGWRSTFPFNTKDEAIKAAIRNEETERDDVPENWIIVEKAK